MQQHRPFWWSLSVWKGWQQQLDDGHGPDDIVNQCIANSRRISWLVLSDIYDIGDPPPLRRASRLRRRRCSQLIHSWRRPLQSARNRTTKSSRQVFFFLLSRAALYRLNVWMACWLSPFVPGNCPLPFHHHLFPHLVSFLSFFRHCRLSFFFFGF